MMPFSNVYNLGIKESGVICHQILHFQMVNSGGKGKKDRVCVSCVNAFSEWLDGDGPLGTLRVPLWRPF